MENQTENSYLENLKKEVAGYATAASNKGSRKTRQNYLAKYFEPRETKELFRMLPVPQGQKHIMEAFFHTLTLNYPGGQKRHNKKIYCSAHNDPKVPKLDADGKPLFDQEGKPVLVPVKCPACEKAKAILKKQDPSIRGIKKDNMTAAQLKVLKKNTEHFNESNKWKAKKFYIIKGVDKGNQKDGVKFWRFKDHFRNQGTLDKLYPVLGEFIDVHGADYADPDKGCDLSITMADGVFNNITYKAVSAITYRPPSKLHEDPIIARQWMSDSITWREVYLPKKAPNITPYEFLEMAIEGNDPYWDDSNQDDKKWRFPGRLDLEEKANTRNQNLDADNEEEFEQASDIVNDGVTISNVTESNVGTFEGAGTDVGAEIEKEVASTTPEPAVNTSTHAEVPDPVANIPTDDPVMEENQSDAANYDDLPF